MAAVYAVVLDSPDDPFSFKPCPLAYTCLLHTYVIGNATNRSKGRV